jgi:hypothetical protein
MAPALRAIPCPNCARAIPPEYWNISEQAACRGCGELIAVRAFPALARGIQATPADAVLAQGEASCFYHPANRAALPCDSCGRFLCALCDLDLDGRHLCPVCLERGVTVDKDPSLEERRVQYDTLALHLATWPVLTFWFPIFTAPTAFYLVIRHWRTPMSILPRSRFRLWLALLLSTAEILAIAAFILLVVWFIPRSEKK